MARRRFADERIAFGLRQADCGAPVGEICRKMGIAEATFSRWKDVDAGMGGEALTAVGARMMASEIRPLKQLEDENS